MVTTINSKAGLRFLLIGVAGTVVAGLWLGGVKFSLPFFYFVMFAFHHNRLVHHFLEIIEGMSEQHVLNAII
jgi:F0F1-type ATP synthase assembly protein I